MPRPKAKKVVCDGYKFDSMLEYERYLYLRDLERKNLIRNLEVHPSYRLVVNGVDVGKFTLDFRYSKGFIPAIEDVKAWRRSKKTGKMLPRVNREFGMKVKLLKALYGVEVVLV